MFSHHHGTLNLRVFVIVEDGRTIGTYNIEVDKAIEQRYLHNIVIEMKWRDERSHPSKGIDPYPYFKVGLGVSTVSTMM